MLVTAAALVGALGGSVARADSAATIVYNAVPSLLPPNMASLGFQATQTSEFGDYVHLAGANRALRTVTVTMSDWALYSEYSSDPRYSANSVTWSHPITLNIYNAAAGAPLNTVGSLIGTVTQTVTIPWRPAEDSANCPTKSDPGYKFKYQAVPGALDTNCYNGLATNITFDLGSLNKTLPNDVIVGIAYNTQTYGAHPIGTPGPYNSLNVGVEGSATVGTDDNLDRVFWNTSTAANYTDHGAGGVGSFREDTAWGVPAVSISEGTIPLRITAAPVVPSDVYVNPTFTGTGTDPDGSGPADQVGYDAFATIQAGVNAVASSGTVHVATGTYTESLNVGKSVTLQGNTHAATITGAMSITAANVTVDGFTLTNPTGTNAVLVNGVSNAHITNNDIHDIGGSGSTVSATGSVQAIYVNRNSTADISGIVISENSISHIRSSGAGSGKSVKAIFVGDSTGSRNVSAAVTGNTVSDVVSSGWGAYGILVNHANSSVDIENNTIGGVTGTFAHAIGLEADTPNARVIGNTISTIVDSNSPAMPDAEAIKFESNPHANQATVTRNSWGSGVPLGIVADSASTAGGPVTAADNWWGSLAAADVHSRIVGSVTADRWCTDAACSTLSNNADLTGLSLSSGALSPGFGSSTTSYSANVGSGVAGVTVTASAHPGASVVISGGDGLSSGNNTVTVTVTSPDGTTRTYTVVVNRASAPAVSGNADLAAMSLSSGAFAPGFGSATTGYSVSVGNDVSAISVSARAADAGARVQVSGGSNLNVGANTVTVKVTAADGTIRTYTVTVVRAAAAAGAAATVAAAPEQSGVASVVLAPTASAAGVGATPAPPVSIDVSWPANTFVVPVEVKVAPQEAPAPPAGGGPTPPPVAVAGGFSVGSSVVQLTVTDVSTGAPITSFQQPITIHLSASQAGATPAYSHDGLTWTPIPQLSSPGLPPGQQDGYFLNPDGSVDIYTLHATLFGLLNDTQAPSKPTLNAQLAGNKLYLTIRGAKDNVRVTGYRLTLNGRGVTSTVRAYLVLSTRVGKYQVLALDAAGNKSKPSTSLKIVRTGNKKQPYKITS